MRALLWLAVGLSAPLAVGGCGGDEGPRDAGAGDSATPDAGPEDAGPPPTFELRVVVAGDGAGTVSDADGLVDCGDGGTTCTASVPAGTELTLEAVVSGPSVFAGWSGGGIDCSDEPTCTVTVTGDTAVTASFDLDELSLMVATGGTGTGTVTSEPAGIDCGDTCAESWTAFTEVTLTATPDASSVFTGWEQGCTGTDPTCTVTLDQATNVRALFDLREVTVEVERTGNGAGAVTSDPAGIDCGDTCTMTVTWGTEVTLDAAVDATTSLFGGWTGCTSDTASCTLTVTDDTMVEAQFTLLQYELGVTVDGTGQGIVTSSPPGIDCGTDCMETYDHGTSVTLTAFRDTATSSFTGWGGACAGETGTACTVSITVAATVTATFDLTPRRLNVGLTGTGTGAVTSAPAGIDCGSDCLEDYPHGTSVDLTATADPSTSEFAGWSGACSGTATTCTVEMNAVKSVTANFRPAQRVITVVVDGTGSGRVSSSPAGIDCPSDCMESFNHGTMVTLSATPGAGSAFTAWSGACAGETSVLCTLTADSDQSVTASFN